jgi:hypothetical protein
VEPRLVDPFITLYFLDLLARYLRDGERTDVPAVTAMSAALGRALTSRLEIRSSRASR